MSLSLAISAITGDAEPPGRPVGRSELGNKYMQFDAISEMPIQRAQCHPREGTWPPGTLLGRLKPHQVRAEA